MIKDIDTYRPRSPWHDRQEAVRSTENEGTAKATSRDIILGSSDETIGYGTITNSCISLLLSREEGMESSRTKSALGLVLDSDMATRTAAATPIGTIMSNGNERDHSKTTRNTLLQRYNNLFALACICCFSFALVGLSRHAQTNGATLFGLFIFDDLFSSSTKKKSSVTYLERLPQHERSLLLVVQADVAPANRIVNDIDRQLTAKGMQDAEGLGQYLDQHNIPEPDWIFSSPSERTAFTTELMRRHWAPRVPVAFEDILYTLEFNDYFSFITGLNDNFHRIMIVGHNPAILNTAKKLMKTHGIEDFPDSGFMEIRWADLKSWSTVTPYSGSAKMAIDPNNNFLFTSPK
eukprot:CAMPEP_0168192450 /NCGR_PEP_ID=MMETSP0139_2-20121125/18055_1 /TAXON_ID=44445 /ORGANISM="Pseudo-nitzschia australis, Strain 10249 10 AB" /LENGTH=348 /DNA_ID=CAMNT_0008115691 /DNA_START=124 /DNA_END=1170 /DNA_ORIENTATION=-